MKRRAFAAAALAVPTSIALSGCLKSSTETGGGGGESTKSLTILLGDDTNIQDLWNKSLIPGFTKANAGYGVQVNFDLHDEHGQQNLAKLSAAVKQGKTPGFDMTDSSVTQAAQADLLLKEDASTLPALADVPEEVMAQGKGAGVPYRGSSVLLSYNTTKVTNPPKTLSDLLAWIKAHPGRFAYNSPKSGGSGASFVTTVLDANMPADIQTKMRTSYDEKLEKYWDPGFKVLHELNKYMYGKGVYPNGNNQVLDLIASGQVDMAPVWSDQFITGQKNGQIPESVKVAQISDPSFTGGANYLGVVKTTEKKDVAQKLLEYLLTPDAQTLIANAIAGYPVIPLDKLPEEVQKKFSSAKPDQLRLNFFSDFGNDMNSLWDQKVPGK